MTVQTAHNIARTLQFRNNMVANHNSRSHLILLHHFQKRTYDMFNKLLAASYTTPVL